MRHATILATLSLVIGCSSGGVTATPPAPIADTADETDSEIGPAPDTGGDSGPKDTGPPPCTTLVNGGAWIDEILVAAAAPTLTGGTIEPGTYALTKYETYAPTGTPGATGKTLKETVAMTATTMETVYAITSGPERRGASTYTFSSKTSIYATDVCGSTDKYVFSYQATPTTLQFGAGGPDAYYVLYFTKK
jgi:hypothetical protein